jgi:hypothetical protein
MENTFFNAYMTTLFVSFGVNSLASEGEFV